MKVLLILAGIAELKATNPVRYPVMSPPLTLLLLGTICRRAGHEVELIDTRLFMRKSGDERWVLDEEGLTSVIARSEAEVAGISFLSSAAEQGFRVAALCKREGKTVIGGGLHASVALPEFVASGSFHYLIQGEAEESFPDLLRSLERGTQERFPRTTVVIQAQTLRDLQIVPAVEDYSLYAPIFEQYSSKRSIYVETSRGCFKSCTFCEVAKTGAAWTNLRKIPRATVMRSIERAVEDYKVNYVLITDSVATAFKRNFLEFVAEMRAGFPGVSLQFNSTVDAWDEERARACRGLSCSIWFGFESGSQRVLDFLQKGTSVERAYEAARLCRQYEIPCAFNVLLGVPGETEEDYRQTFAVFENCPWVYPNPNILNPLPGTAMHRYCEQRGLMRAEKSYDIWDAERIERENTGPVRGVDYGLVLKYYKLLTELQDEPQRALSK